MLLPPIVEPLPIEEPHAEEPSLLRSLLILFFVILFVLWALWAIPA